MAPLQQHLESNGMSSPTSPKLTIAIPTWNRAQYLRMNLRRLLEEMSSLPPGKVEILVSDNHSTDETPDIVAKVVEAGLPVRYIRNAKDVGSDANIAQCFNEAHGDYVQILGDDDLYVRGTLARVVSLLEPDDYGVLCLRPFGYDSDPDEEYPGRTGRICEFLEVGKFLSTVGPLITFISAMVVNRRIQPDVDARQFCGSHLVQVHLVLQAAISARKNAFLREYTLLASATTAGTTRPRSSLKTWGASSTATSRTGYPTKTSANSKPGCCCRITPSICFVNASPAETACATRIGASTCASPSAPCFTSGWRRSCCFPGRWPSSGEASRR
jgi:Glycosyl transferase family 2